MFDEVFQAMKTLTVTYAAPDFPAAKTGPLPIGGGLSIYMGPGYPTERFLDRGGIYRLPYVLNGKHSDQEKLSSAMSRIHYELSMLTDLPYDEENGLWRITAIESSTPPNYLSKEDSGQWLYGSILTATVYMKGVK